MSAAARLAGFAALMAVVFATAALAGGLIDPEAPGGDGAGASSHGGAATAHAAEDPRPAGTPAALHGLAVAENGLRLVLDTPELRRGRPQALRFRVLDQADGDTVRDFDVEHTRRMHLILVRRDTTGFQHLHPRQDAAGAWSTTVTLAAPGSYRVFADFSHGGTATTLAGELRVDGDADLRPLPAPRPIAATSSGGYAVRLETGPVRAGAATDLRFTVSHDGRAVRTQPYLGAGGHLVALREGDLAFLHVHPTAASGPDAGHEASTGRDAGEAGHAGAGQSHDEDAAAVGFRATFPSAGRYRLFLQFQHEGRVRTVAFTQEVSR